MRWILYTLGLILPALACTAQEPGRLTFHDRVDVYRRNLLGPVPFARSLFIAGIQQWRDSPHEWGQGMSGYGRRFSHRYGVLTAANSVKFGVAALIGEDTRYFAGGGPGLARIGHAVKGAFIAPVESGGTRFAWARIAGAFGSAALSNAWCPDRYRTAGNTMERAGLALAGDVAGNVFLEFWPGIKRKLFKR